MVNSRMVQQYVAEKIKNPSANRSSIARKVGYAESVARRPKAAIESTKSYKELLAKYCPQDKVLTTLSECLDATKPVVVNNEITDYADYGTRVSAVKLSAQLHGMLSEQQTTVNVNVLSQLLSVKDTDIT